MDSMIHQKIDDPDFRVISKIETPDEAIEEASFVASWKQK